MPNLLSKKILIPLVAVIIIGGGIAAYLITRFDNPSSNQPTKTSFVGNSDANSDSAKKKQSIASTNDSTTGTNSSSAQTKPQVPSGTFVSNHNPNLSGSPAPDSENSTCITNVGATCKITFTQGNMVKSLPAKTVDSSGAVVWNWKLQDIGLTTGAWKITAVANNGSLSSSTSDPLVLTVGN